MKRLLNYGYALVSYIFFLLVYGYFILWENNTIVPVRIDQGTSDSLPEALLTNILLMAIFFVPHSIMARNWFKTWWTKIISPILERSTYVLISSLLMANWIYFWRPIPIVIYDLSESWIGTFLMICSFFGFFLAVFSTFLINHFDLFGLKQIIHVFRPKKETPYRFVTPLLYQIVRHSLYLGFIIAFWSNSEFTIGHLLFSSLATVYTLIGIDYEEKDLKQEFGETYKKYSQAIPKLIPSIMRSKAFLFVISFLILGLFLAYLLGPIG